LVLKIKCIHAESFEKMYVYLFKEITDMHRFMDVKMTAITRSS
jgi:hypothetical protein